MIPEQATFQLPRACPRQGGIFFILPWLGLLSICIALGGCDPNSDASAHVAVPNDGKTIGLLLSEYDYAFPATADGKEECPEGLVHSGRENWEAQFPTLAARKAHFERCGQMDNRGPNCESVWVAPELVKDPLPYREVRGATAFGIDLDGIHTGQATATTCAHQNFVGLDGQKGVDNQYYRLLGCQRGMRGSAVEVASIRRFIGQYRLLLEITGVDDEMNDDRVEVAIHYGQGPTVLDVDFRAVPWQTQHIGATAPAYQLRGRISNGELTTEPVDIRWNFGYGALPVLVRGSRLQLRLTASGAEGLHAGYVDAKEWWESRRANPISFVGDSGPATYAALHELADGYKDPQTGTCTALSSALKLDFVRVFTLRSAAAGASGITS